MGSQQIGIAVLTLAGLALGGDETGSSRNSPRATDILLKRCTLEYKKTSLLGANQIGVLEECRVAPGDKVKAGQVLGHLRDEEFRAELEARATQAASDIAIRVAEARHKLAQSQLERTQKLINRNYCVGRGTEYPDSGRGSGTIVDRGSSAEQEVGGTPAEADGGHDPVARDQKPA